MSTLKHPKRVIVLGGGFGGVKTALELAKLNLPDLKITLISDKAHFEYYPTLYRVVTGYSSAQVCVPLAEIFEGKNVEVIQDCIRRVDLHEKALYGGIDSPHCYDYLVLAVGSETGYFNIPGIDGLSYGFKSIAEAQRLKQHFHEVLTPSLTDTLPEQKAIAAHFVIVGGGPTGIELAGELVRYSRHLAKNHGFDPAFITIDLIEAAPRLLPILPPDVSERVKNYLNKAGVNIYLNRTVIKEEVEELLLKDMSMKTKTVVWTAGVKPNKLVPTIEGLTLDKRGKVEVTTHMQAKGHSEVLVIGDIASNQYAGMAQTADYDGKYIAKYFAAKLRGEKAAAYVPHKPVYAIPAGPDWAAILWGNVRIFGRPARFLRNMADLRYFMSILPFGKAYRTFHKSDSLAESCPVCVGTTKV
jgi:NADH dehydrogenase